MLRDPALLVWLDAPANRKGHPNENLARELMELFTLGIGHYSEDDVKEAARALTGWTLVDDEARFVPPGTTRARRRSSAAPARSTPTTWPRCCSSTPPRPAGWPGGSATSSSARARSTRPRSPRWPRACGRTTSTSAGPSRRSSARGSSSPPPTWAGASSSPVEFVVGAVRALELFDPPPSTLVLADWCGRLGQDLFYPPNVGGWPGGRAWLTTRSAIGRANFAAALVAGASVGLGTPLDPLALAARHGQRRNPAFFAQLLLGADSPEVPLDELGSARQALTRLLASPEAQRHLTRIPGR